VELKEIAGYTLTVSNVGANRHMVHLEGQIGSSSYDFRNATFEVRHGVLEIRMMSMFARSGYIGWFSITKTIDQDFNKIVFSSNKTVIWTSGDIQRENRTAHSSLGN
jgi:hypothetical protein